MLRDSAEGDSPPPNAGYSSIETRDEKDNFEKDYRITNEVFEVDQDPILICDTDLFWKTVDAHHEQTE
jgi:hypothetical protein